MRRSSGIGSHDVQPQRRTLFHNELSAHFKAKASSARAAGQEVVVGFSRLPPTFLRRGGVERPIP